MQLPPELAFLSPFFAEATEIYRTAIWLISDFDAQTWEYSFEHKQTRQLDWRITLDDGSQLTDAKNVNLLEGLKYYLTSCTRGSDGYVETNELRGAQYHQFCHAFHIIDYLLMNGKRLQLGTYGLEGLTGGNLIEVLEAIASSPTIAESVYDWSNRLREFCMSSLNSSNQVALHAVLQNNPTISIITQDQVDEDKLDLPYELIPKIRASLYLKNLYHRQAKGNQPNTVMISNLIYPETLWGKHQSKPVPEILCYHEEIGTFQRELPAAPLKSSRREFMGESIFLSYRRAIYNFGTLHELDIPAPAIDALKQAEMFHPNLSPTGRFRTLPSDIVFKALRQSIEFHLALGQNLTKAFCRIALECKKRGTIPSSLTNEEVQTLVGAELRNFGVKQLSMSVLSKQSDGNTKIVKTAKTQKTTKSTSTKNSLESQKHEYYTKLRNNNGLYELLAVYIGAIQLTLGILMARRASELFSLEAKDCLDETAEWLIFMNAKSTRHLFGIRCREARPIEPVAADMIKNLIRMQKILLRIGYISKLKTLFCLPDFRGGKRMSESSEYLYNRNFDLLCDYFEMPLNTQSQRYYLRQHQLRRFFAMLFFYCGSFAKLDTLQWMMGHADPKHVYRYITESTDGVVLAGAKAHFAAERLVNGDEENFQDLAKLLKERHGTKNFTMVDAHDLEDQIQELIVEGWIEIEPEFFDDHQGTQFKVVARLKRNPGVV